MLTAVLFILAPDRATRILFNGEWVNKLPPLNNGCYWAAKREELREELLAHTISR